MFHLRVDSHTWKNSGIMGVFIPRTRNLKPEALADLGLSTWTRRKRNWRFKFETWTPLKLPWVKRPGATPRPHPWLKTRWKTKQRSYVQLPNLGATIAQYWEPYIDSVQINHLTVQVEVTPPSDFHFHPHMRWFCPKRSAMPLALACVGQHILIISSYHLRFKLTYLVSLQLSQVPVQLGTSISRKPLKTSGRITWDEAATLRISLEENCLQHHRQPFAINMLAKWWSLCWCDWKPLETWFMQWNFYLAVSFCLTNNFSKQQWSWSHMESSHQWFIGVAPPMAHHQKLVDRRILWGPSQKPMIAQYH